MDNKEILITTMPNPVPDKYITMEPLDFIYEMFRVQYNLPNQTDIFDNARIVLAEDVYWEVEKVWRWIENSLTQREIPFSKIYFSPAFLGAVRMNRESVGD